MNLNWPAFVIVYLTCTCDVSNKERKMSKQQRRKDAATEGGLCLVIAALCFIIVQFVSNSDARFILFGIAGSFALLAPYVIWRVLTGRDTFV
jgi:hypothetical protein